MPPEGENGNPQTGNDGKGDPPGEQQPPNQQQPPPENKNGGGDGGDNQDPEALKKALDAERKARREAERSAKAEKDELERLRKEKQEREDAEKTELEKAQAEVERVKREAAEKDEALKSERIRNSVILAASSLNIVDPDAAEKLLDKSAITFADDGKPENISELLNELIKSRPWLVKAKDGGSDGPPPSPKPGEQPQMTEAEKKARQESNLRSAARNF